MAKKRIIMERLVRRSECGREFDLEFWDKVGAEGRFAAAWDMVREVMVAKGLSERQMRMQRSVESVVRLRATQKKTRHPEQ
jgi:hypothetical protein